MAVSKVCPHCKGEFQVPPYRAESAVYCSKACRSADAKHEASCLTCGSQFSQYKSSNSRMKFCSMECYLAKTVKVEEPKPERPKYFKSCEVCERVFKVTLTRKDTARFCSRDCQKLSKTFKSECSEVQAGEKHWRWSGGEYQFKSGYIRSKKKTLGVETATLNHRTVVLAAMLVEAPWHPFLIDVDGVKKLSSEVEVHHIDRKRANNDLSNLLAVTKPAHARIHHYGKKPEPWECWPSNPPRW